MRKKYVIELSRGLYAAHRFVNAGRTYDVLKAKQYESMHEAEDEIRKLNPFVFPAARIVQV